MSTNVDDCCYLWCEIKYVDYYKKLATDNLYKIYFLILLVNICWSIYMIDLYRNADINKFVLDNGNTTYVLDIESPYFQSSEYKLLEETVYGFYVIHILILTCGLFTMVCPNGILILMNVLIMVIYIFFVFPNQVVWFTESDEVKADWKKYAYGYWLMYNLQISFYWMNLGVFLILILINYIEYYKKKYSNQNSNLSHPNTQINNSGNQNYQSIV